VQDIVVLCNRTAPGAYPSQWRGFVLCTWKGLQGEVQRQPLKTLKGHRVGGW